MRLCRQRVASRCPASHPGKDSTGLHLGRPPAEADMQRYFCVTPPSVHQMALTLEQTGLIRRQPGVAPASKSWSIRSRCPRCRRPSTRVEQLRDLLAGIVLTQLRNTLYYSPAVSPIYLQKISDTLDKKTLLSMIGPISPAHELYPAITMHMREIEEVVAHFPPTAASFDGKVTRMIPRTFNVR